ncbi:MAG: hypothetical protein EBR09_14785 [Proteobacteria bacterium]|nr:hypothetical protein [Pseudomonadota bacterium]
MKSLIITSAVFLFAGCRSGGSGIDNGAEAQAVKRSVSNGQISIIAQQDDDMRLLDTMSLYETGSIEQFKTGSFQHVRIKLADGREGKVQMVREGSVSMIVVRGELTDGFLGVGKNVVKDAFLVPNINGKVDPALSKAFAEKWAIKKIVADADNYGELKGGVKIYCPNRVELKKKDGSMHIAAYESVDCKSTLSILEAEVVGLKK